MKRSIPSKAPEKVAVALSWDGARWPIRSLPPKARAFLAVKSRAPFSRRKITQLLVDEEIDELRICWVPRLKGGTHVLADIFPAPRGVRVPFRATKMRRFGDFLGVVYRRER